MPFVRVGRVSTRRIAEALDGIEYVGGRPNASTTAVFRAGRADFDSHRDLRDTRPIRRDHRCGSGFLQAGGRSRPGSRFPTREARAADPHFVEAIDRQADGGRAKE